MAERLTPRYRTLTPAERRLLEAKASQLRAGSANAPKVFLLGLGVAAVLWALTVLASDSPWTVVTLFWLVVGGGIALWVWTDARRVAVYTRSLARGMESALEADRAEVFDIRSRAFAELEELEDEGACWAFDLGDGRIVFVTGQDFYPEARFPSLDFSIVHPLDAEGAPVDRWIEKRGELAEPVRVVPKEVKATLEIPEHLAVVRGRLEDLESLLA